MSHPRFATIGNIEMRLVEELSEVIQVIAKGDRFGWANWHPNDSTKHSNVSRLRAEMADAVAVWNELADRIGLPRLVLADEPQKGGSDAEAD